MELSTKTLTYATLIGKAISFPQTGPLLLTFIQSDLFRFLTKHCACQA